MPEPTACTAERVDGRGERVPCGKPADWHDWAERGQAGPGRLSPDWTHHRYAPPVLAGQRRLL